MREYKKPLFTKKHFEYFAEELAKFLATQNVNRINLESWFIELFMEDNTNFNAYKFGETLTKNITETIDNIIKETNKQ
jgi:hypothetical protein